MATQRKEKQSDNFDRICDNNAMQKKTSHHLDQQRLPQLQCVKELVDTPNSLCRIRMTIAASGLGIHHQQSAFWGLRAWSSVGGVVVTPCNRFGSAVSFESDTHIETS